MPVTGTCQQRAAALAERQRGRVSRSQLLAAGLSSSTITRLVARGHLWCEHAGVYAVGHLADIPGGPEAAALLAVRPGGMLSHRTARRGWGMAHGAQPPSSIHVTVAGHHGGRPRGVVVHRSTILDPRDVRVLDGLPITSPARTLLDEAATLATRELERALDTGLVEHTVTLGELRELLSRAGRHHGAAALGTLVQAHGPTTFTRSEAEERFLALVREAGLPAPLVNVCRHGYELDFLWPQAAYAVEIDGRAFHSTPLRRARDRRRDDTLRGRGIEVDRFGWHEVVDSGVQVAARVATRLATRSSR